MVIRPRKLRGRGRISSEFGPLPSALRPWHKVHFYKKIPSPWSTGAWEKATGFSRRKLRGFRLPEQPLETAERGLRPLCNLRFPGWKIVDQSPYLRAAANAEAPFGRRPGAAGHGPRWRFPGTRRNHCAGFWRRFEGLHRLWKRRRFLTNCSYGCGVHPVRRSASIGPASTLRAQ